jgi:hypothetical protein
MVLLVPVLLVPVLAVPVQGIPALRIPEAAWVTGAAARPSRPILAGAAGRQFREAVFVAAK